MFNKHASYSYRTPGPRPDTGGLREFAFEYRNFQMLEWIRITVGNLLTMHIPEPTPRVSDS